MNEKKTLKQLSILFLCVNYHADNETRDLIHNLDQLAHAGSLQAIIVNNGAKSNSDATFARLEPKQLKLTVINAPENLGYFGGAQRGFDQFLQSASLPDWVIVSNSDIYIQDPYFFTKLCGFDFPAAVIGPRILSTRTGQNQNPYMRQRPSARRMRFYRYIFNTPGLCATYHLASGLRQKYAARHKSHEQWSEGYIPELIYAPHGSFIIFHRSYFENGCNFRYGAFLYGEEIFVAEQARAKKLPVYYWPELLVHHREHIETGLYPSLRIRSFIAQSSAFLTDQYFGDLR